MKKRFFSFVLATAMVFGCFTNVTITFASEDTICVSGGIC